MHTIGIDAFSSRREKTGVEWYTHHLLRTMEPLTPPEWQVFLYSLRTTNFDTDIRTLSQWEEKKLWWPPKRGYGQVRLSWEMLRRPPNVLFMPHAPIPFVHPHGARRKTVATIHDVGFLTRPDLYHPQDRYRQLFGLQIARRHAARVFAVSDATKRDLIERAGFDEKKIIVTPLGVDHERYRSNLDAARIQTVQEKYQLPESYFLYVGRIDAKKNIPTLIRAYHNIVSAKVLADRPKLWHLVLAGSLGFHGQEVVDMVRSLGLGNATRFLNWIPEDDLPFLYAGARAFVFPSAYEGFGLPVLQAMACGVPTVCSEIPALREVAGDVALFAPSSDVEAWTNALDRIVADDSLRIDLKNRGLARASLFSWERTAQLTWQGICDTM